MSKDLFQIQQNIESKEALLKSIFDPTTFTLNPEIEGIMRDIQELQDECTHQFENGRCIYCHKEESV